MSCNKVPQECPGTESKEAGQSEACQGCPNRSICQEGPKELTEQEIQQKNVIQNRLQKIKHKIIVMSGKGGVGKSTLSTLIAQGLAYQGKEVGLLDLDLCGPSIPKTTDLEGQEIHQSAEGWEPVYAEDNLAVMSIGFLLPNKDDPVIWRGPKKNGLIQQFLTDVNWGELDYLIIDTPPGTSDEHISIVQLLNMNVDKDGAVLITTGQNLSVNDVRKQVGFCHKTGVNIKGVVENMSQYVCNECGCQGKLFQNKAKPIQKMCQDFNLNFLGQMSFSDQLLDCIENGENIFMSENKDKGLDKIKEEILKIVQSI